MPPWLLQDKDGLLLRVRVKPRGRRNAVEGVRGNALMVTVTAAPEDGKANAAVIEVLSRVRDSPRSAIEIARGHTSRDKTVRVVGVGLANAREKLQTLASLQP
jgi:uncharacterized protein (TIGR00251 family)